MCNHKCWNGVLVFNSNFRCKIGCLLFWCRLSWIWNIISVLVEQEDILSSPFLFSQKENFFRFKSLNKPAGRHPFLNIVSRATGFIKGWGAKWKWNHWLSSLLIHLLGIFFSDFFSFPSPPSPPSSPPLQCFFFFTNSYIMLPLHRDASYIV